MHGRGSRSGRRWTAGLLLGGVLLSGCGGGNNGTQERADQRGAASGPPNAGTRAPEQDFNAPQDGARQDTDRDDRDGRHERETERDPDAGMRSTFALDVDTASYSYAKRQLRAGRLPAPGTVRPEEFVNSFRQGYKQPQGDGFAVSMDGARSKDEDWTLLRVGLATKAETAEERERGPASLTFVVDVSGSMAEPGRLDLVKTSMRTMVDQLRDDDALSVVSFSDRAKTVLPMTTLDGRSQRAKARGAIEALETEGSTNLHAGLRTGYQEAVKGVRAGATNRVVLLSDALANTGSTNAADILEDVGKARKDHGITLFGVGVGSEYGDTLMEKLTNKGDGNTVYVGSRKEADRVFVHDLARNIEVRARDAKAQVVFNRRNVQDFRLVGYDNRRVADEDFRDDTVDGGEVGPGHTVTAMYAVKLRSNASGPVATTTVRWLDPKTRKPTEARGEIAESALNGALWQDGSPRLRTAAIATYFAEALRVPRRGSGGTRTHALPGDPGLGTLQREAWRAARQLEDKDVTELGELIRGARDIAG